MLVDSVITIYEQVIQLDSYLENQMSSGLLILRSIVATTPSILGPYWPYAKRILLRDPLLLRQ